MKPKNFETDLICILGIVVLLKAIDAYQNKSVLVFHTDRKSSPEYYMTSNKGNLSIFYWVTRKRVGANTELD